MAEGPLSDLKVVELAQRITGPYCGKVLADMGAEVVKVEPPGVGDESRRMGPFPGDEPHPEKSGMYLYLNTNKLGVTIDVTTREGKALFKELIAQADILIENNPPQRMEKLGLTFDELREVNPRLVMTSITAFGQTGPYRDYKADDMVSFHIGGMGYETPQHGVESLDLPPLRPGAYQSDFLTGSTAATATMSGLFARDVSGEAQHVDVSEQEVMVGIMTRINLHQYTYEGQEPERTRPLEHLLNYVACKDGYVNIFVNEQHLWKNLVKVMGEPDWATDPIWESADFRAQGWDAAQPLIELWALNYTKEELFRMCQAGHVPCLPGYTFEDLLKSEHLWARGFFVEIDHPVAGRFTAPGAPYRFSATPWAIRRPAPTLGQHNTEILDKRLGHPREELVRLRGWGVV